jgi:hypothetical protein
MTYGWIEEKHAVIGNRLNLRGTPNGTEGWVVAETWGRRSAADVKAHERDWKHQRSVSDV